MASMFSVRESESIRTSHSYYTNSPSSITGNVDAATPRQMKPEDEVALATDSATPGSDTSVMGRFTRRVSFNNLHPDWSEPPPTWNPAYTSNNSNYTYSNDPMFGYGTSNVNDISKAYSQQPVKKKLKLPDPPSKSILKNKLSPQQSKFNAENANYDDNTETNITTKPDTPMPTTRRKSYAEMTDEELMALDPQFQTTKSKTTNMDKFKFDSQSLYYAPTSRRQSWTGPPPRQIWYPTSNENNYESISLTVKHNEFDQFQYNRTILTVISGRKHTWNSVDWLLNINSSIDELSNSFLQDGDYLVISALIPLKFLRDHKKNSKKCKMDEYLYKKCEKLLDYVVNAELLKQNNLRLKITVEFVTDKDTTRSSSNSGPSSSTPSSSTSGVYGFPATHFNPNLTGNKYMLHHLFKQYQPNLVVIGNKSSNLNFKYPIKMKKQFEKDQYLIKLSSYLVKYSTVPVILVGSNTRFHNKTGTDSRFTQPPHAPQPQSLTFDLDRRNSKQTHSPNPVFKVEEVSSSKESSPTQLDRKSSNVSASSNSESIESTQSYTGESAGYDFNEHLDLLATSGDENRFKDMIILISDKSLGDSKNYLSALSSKDDSVKIDTKIHSIYRSQTTGHSAGLTNSNGIGYGGSGNGLYRNSSTDSGSPELSSSSDRIYKVKSLISYDAEDELKNSKMREKKRKNRESFSAQSNSSDKSKGKKEKRSIWQKLGLKKK